MNAANGFSALLNPASVAVIGATDEVTKLRGRLLKILVGRGYPGKIYPVARKAGTVQGLRAHPTVGAIGEPVDLAMVAVPAASVSGVLDECAEAGVRSVIVHTASDGEHDLNQVIAKFAARTGIRVLGPNTEGVYNVVGQVAANFAPVLDPALSTSETLADRDDRVSIVSQSGGVGFGMYGEAVRAGIGFRHVVITGGEADVDLLSATEALLDEGESRAIVWFVEGIRNPERFAAVASRAADAGVPLIAMKVGRSEAGRRSAISHTGALAGADAAYDAMFDRYGVVRVSDLEEVVGAAAVLGRGRLPRGDRVAIATTTGGLGGWAADLCGAAHLRTPELSGALRTELDEFIPSYGSTANPIDVTADALQNGGTGLVRALAAVGAADEIDSVAVLLNLAAPGRIESMASILHPALASFAKPVVFVSSSPAAAENIAAVRAAGASYASLRGATLGLAAALRYAQFRERWAARATRREPRLCPALGSSAQQLLQSCGVTLAPETVARSESEAVAFADQTGYPVVLKVSSPDIPHKTEAKAVALDLSTADEVRAACQRVLDNARTYRPEARIAGIQVQKMMPPGREMVLGMVRDEDFGPMLMLGFGGIYVDVLRDVVFQPVPVGPADARRMISGLRGSEVLNGVRGEAGADVEALAGLIVRLSELIEDTGDRIVELDLNPVVVYPPGQGYAVVDALVVEREEA